MNQHFRTAVLTIILAGGTICSYAAAYAVMGDTQAQAEVSSMERSQPVGRTDMSLNEACAPAGSVVARKACAQALVPARLVRVIDFATLEAGSRIR